MKSLPDSLKIKKIEEKGNFDQAAILKAACHD
jgi:hypothetical protein